MPAAFLQRLRQAEESTMIEPPLGQPSESSYHCVLRNWGAATLRYGAWTNARGLKHSKTEISYAVMAQPSPDGAERTKLITCLQALYDSEVVGFVEAGHGYSPHATEEALATFNIYLQRARHIDQDIPDLKYTLPRGSEYESQVHHGELLANLKTVIAHIDPERLPRLRDYLRLRADCGRDRYSLDRPGGSCCAKRPNTMFFSATRLPMRI